MTNHYTIQILSTNTDLKVTYRNNRFRKLEHLRGTLDQTMMNSLGKIIPVKEVNFNQFIEHYKGKVNYNKEQAKTKTIYSQFLGEWYAFYNRFVGLTPKFDGTDGRALKMIISYLKKIGSSEQEALALWQLILSKWDTLNDFHKENTDLKYINSQLNKIVYAVKHKSKTNAQGANGSVNL